jgi:aspartate dehydrogenase
MTEQKRIGMVGCGTIGTQLARSITKYFQDRARLVVICDKHDRKAQQLSNDLNPHPDVLPMESVPLHCDLLIEAASNEASRELVPKALEMGRDIMVMSVGGLVDIYGEVFAQAQSRRARIYIPSGPVAGIGALEAAMTGGVTSVRLSIRIPPKSLTDVSYVRDRKLELHELLRDTTIFEGSAREAIQYFPLNSNVAATVAFAGLGLDQTQVRIITGPAVLTAIHELEVEGAFGRLATMTENNPTSENPKTTTLAILSACALLNEILNPVKIGT